MPGFDDILGHDAVKRHFQKAIQVRKVSHAYILAGEAGMGKKSLANAFALTLLCENDQNRPCMKCHSCRQVLSGNHPDLIRVSHEKPQSIGVEDIRDQINDTVMIRPYNGSYKIYIVDEAEKMTVQAQNALLKTIEEPPGYAIILLLTANADALLPTILSRCVQLKLQPLRDSEVRDYLTEIRGVSEADARLYTAFARGNLGKAVRLAESDDFRYLYDELVYLLKNVKNLDLSEMMEKIRQWKDEELDIDECLDFIQMWYRDALVFKTSEETELLFFRKESEFIEQLSRETGYGGFEKILEAIDRTKLRLTANVNMELAMELLLLVIKEN